MSKTRRNKNQFPDREDRKVGSRPTSDDGTEESWEDEDEDEEWEDDEDESEDDDWEPDWSDEDDDLRASGWGDDLVLDR